MPSTRRSSSRFRSGRSWRHQVCHQRSEVSGRTPSSSTARSCSSSCAISTLRISGTSSLNAKGGAVWGSRASPKTGSLTHWKGGAVWGSHASPKTGSLTHCPARRAACSNRQQQPPLLDECNRCKDACYCGKEDCASEYPVP
jgi:hypothetical protein